MSGHKCPVPGNCNDLISIRPETTFSVTKKSDQNRETSHDVLTIRLENGAVLFLFFFFFFVLFSGGRESVIARESVRRWKTAIALDVWRRRGGGGQQQQQQLDHQQQQQHKKKTTTAAASSSLSLSKPKDERGGEREREELFFFSRASVSGCFLAPRPQPQLQPRSSAAEANESN